MKTEELKKQIVAARSRYYRLVLLGGLAATGKTKILVQIAKDEGYPYINLNLILSQKLLEYPAKIRALRHSTKPRRSSRLSSEATLF
ncbi:MAG: BREX-3 system P-loop-containing protein BrxF, partial [Moorellaceae bacterium]